MLFAIRAAHVKKKNMPLYFMTLNANFLSNDTHRTRVFLQVFMRIEPFSFYKIIPISRLITFHPLIKHVKYRKDN